MKHTTLTRLTLLTLTLALSAIPFSGRATTPTERRQECRYQGRTPGYSKAEIRTTIACAVTKSTVPGGFGDVLAVALRESGLNPYAVAPNGCCAGIYQEHLRWWPGRVAAWRAAHPHGVIGDSPFNARANVVVSIWLMHLQGGPCPAWC